MTAHLIVLAGHARAAAQRPTREGDEAGEIDA